MMQLKKLLSIGALLGAFLLAAQAQGIFNTGEIFGNPTAAPRAPTTVSPRTARSSSLLNIDQITSVGNTNYTILVTDRVVGTNAAFTAPRTWTLPAANAVNPGQMLIIADFQGTVTGPNALVIARAGADTINGGTSVTIVVANGAYALWSDGVSKWTAQAIGTSASASVTSVTCNGLVITTSGVCPEPFSIENCSLAGSVAANLLTVTLNDAAGSTPSASSPCRISFRSATATDGTYATTSRSVTAATSINTNAVGATLGAQNSKAFRFWVVAFDNGGTVVLALYNAFWTVGASPMVNGYCYPIDESLVQSSTPISGSAASQAVYYTPNGTTVSSKAIRILGYVEYNATGLVTAGTYATAPNFVVTAYPSMKRPCDTVKSHLYTTSTGVSTVSTSYSTALTGTFVPNSAANHIRISTMGSTFASGIMSVQGHLVIANNTTQLASASIFNGNSGGMFMGMALQTWDRPNSLAVQTYNVNVNCDGTRTCAYGAYGDTGAFATLEITEIMD